MRCIVPIVMAVVLGGCAAKPQQGSLFEDSDPGEVGATHFAVTSVTPLSEVEAELQPNFAIDERIALSQVAPPTMRESAAQTEVSRLAVGAGYFDPTGDRYDSTPRGGRGSGGGGGNGRGSTVDEAPDEQAAPADTGSRGRGGRGGGGAGGGGGRGSSADTNDMQPLSAAAARGSGYSSGGRGGSSGSNSTGRSQSSNRNDPYLNERDVIPLPGSRGGTESQLVAPPAPAGPVEIEPELRYTLATSLIQYVRLMNRYVRDMVHLDGYDAYIVRVQIGLMPLSRQAQYDTYVDIAFLPSGEATGRTPKVIPILTTDSVEGLLQSKTTADVKDLALQLRALVSGVGGGIDAEHLTQTLDAISGQDLNSLVTVGRASDNVLRVRLGAAAQPSGRFVMLPRTHTVPIVLLIPKGDQGKTPPQIAAVSKTVFVNALTGKIRRGRVKWDEIEKLGPIRDTYELFKYPDQVYELSELTRTGDYPAFVKAIRDADGGRESSVERLGKLWLEALSLRATEAIQTVEVPLPAIRRGTPPPPQTAVLYDDGEFASISLRGGNELDRLPLDAILEIHPAKGGEPVRFRAESLAGRSPDQRDIYFRFPSPSGAGVTIEPGEAATNHVSLILKAADPTSTEQWTYPVLYVTSGR